MALVILGLASLAVFDLARVDLLLRDRHYFLGQTPKILEPRWAWLAWFTHALDPNPATL